MSDEEKLVSHYRLKTLLRRDGFGAVYLSEDTRDQREVVLRVIELDHATLTRITGRVRSRSQRDHPLIEQIRQRMKRIAELKNSHILSVIEFGEEHIQGNNDIIFYMASPFEKESLLSYWSMHYSDVELITLEMVADLLVQAAEALYYVHKHGLIHQYVRLSSFMLRSSARSRKGLHLLLTDFWFADISAALLEEGQVSQDLSIYLAPEQLAEKAFAASDQYALAVMAYELLLGHRLSQLDLSAGLYASLVRQRSGSVETADLELAQRIDQILARALAEDASARFLNIEEFAYTFRSASRGEVVELDDEATFKLPAISKRQQATEMAAAAAAGLAAGAIVEGIAETRSAAVEGDAEIEGQTGESGEGTLQGTAHRHGLHKTVLTSEGMEVTEEETLLEADTTVTEKTSSVTAAAGFAAGFAAGEVVGEALAEENLTEEQTQKGGMGGAGVVGGAGLVGGAEREGGAGSRGSAEEQTRMMGAGGASLGGAERGEQSEEQTQKGGMGGAGVIGGAGVVGWEERRELSEEQTQIIGMGSAGGAGREGGAGSRGSAEEQTRMMGAGGASLGGAERGEQSEEQTQKGGMGGAGVIGGAGVVGWEERRELSEEQTQIIGMGSAGGAEREGGAGSRGSAEEQTQIMGAGGVGSVAEGSVEVEEEQTRLGGGAALLAAGAAGLILGGAGLAAGEVLAGALESTEVAGGIAGGVVGAGGGMTGGGAVGGSGVAGGAAGGGMTGGGAAGGSVVAGGGVAGGGMTGGYGTFTQGEEVSETVAVAGLAGVGLAATGVAGGGVIGGATGGASGGTSRRRRRPWLIAAILALILVLLGGTTLVFAFSGNQSTATVTLTLQSHTIQESYVVTASTTTTTTTQGQIQARFLTQSATQSQSGKVSGYYAGAYATGFIRFTSTATGCGCPVIVPAGTAFTSANGVTVVTDTAASVAALCTVTVTAHAVSYGPVGDIPASTIKAAYSSTISATNPYAFTGGQVGQNNSIVKQSDIDHLASTLQKQTTSSAQTTLQSQLQTSEHLFAAPVCQSKTTSNHRAGDFAGSVTVTVTTTCTAEAYDYTAAMQTVQQQIETQASTYFSSQFVLVGKLQTQVASTTLVDAKAGKLLLVINVIGKWASKFSDRLKQTAAHSIVNDSVSDARALLASLNGVASVDIKISGGDQNKLPSDASKISVVLNS